MKVCDRCKQADPKDFVLTLMIAPEVPHKNPGERCKYNSRIELCVSCIQLLQKELYIFKNNFLNPPQAAKP